MMNAAHLNPRSELRPPVQFYRRLNRQLDQEVVPYTVNEATIRIIEALIYGLPMGPEGRNSRL